MNNYGIKDVRMNLLLDIAKENELNVLFNWDTVVVYADEYDYNESVSADTVQEALHKLVYETNNVVNRVYTLDELEALDEGYYERAFVQYLYNTDIKIKQSDTHIHHRFFSCLTMFEDLLGIKIDRHEDGMPTGTFTGNHDVLKLSDNEAMNWLRRNGILGKYNDILRNDEDEDYYFFTLLDNLIESVKHGYASPHFERAVGIAISEALEEFAMDINDLETRESFEEAMQDKLFNKYGVVVEG